MTRLFAASALALLAASPAWAHTGGANVSGLLAGVQHPVSGLDHVLAMVAVGLWGAQLGGRAVWVLPAAFPVAMAGGGLLGLLGVPMPGVEVGIALSALVLGAAVLLAARPPLLGAALLVGAFAVFHGHAHGGELPPGADALLYSLGFVLSTALLHAAGLMAGLAMRRPSRRLALRGAGAAIAAAGPVLLFGALG